MVLKQLVCFLSVLFANMQRVVLLVGIRFLWNTHNNPSLLKRRQIKWNRSSWSFYKQNEDRLKAYHCNDIPRSTHLCTNKEMHTNTHTYDLIMTSTHTNVRVYIKKRKEKQINHAQIRVPRQNLKLPTTNITCTQLTANSLVFHPAGEAWEDLMQCSPIMSKG